MKGGEGPRQGAPSTKGVQLLGLSFLQANEYIVEA